MKTSLSQEQEEQIKESFRMGNFSAPVEIQKLIDAGLEEKTAANLILDILKEYKLELVNKKLQKEKSDQEKNITIGVIFMVSLIGPVFDIANALWYTCAIIIAGVLGYVGFKDKPFAGAVGAILVTVLFPWAYQQYFSNRRSYIRIELLIPFAMAAIPAWLVGFIVGKIFYSNSGAS